MFEGGEKGSVFLLKWGKKKHTSLTLTGVWVRCPFEGYRKRETGFGPATFSLARRRTTAVLLPQRRFHYTAFSITVKSKIQTRRCALDSRRSPPHGGCVPSGGSGLFVGAGVLLGAGVLVGGGGVGEGGTGVLVGGAGVAVGLVVGVAAGIAVGGTGVAVAGRVTVGLACPVGVPVTAVAVSVVVVSVVVSVPGVPVPPVHALSFVGGCGMPCAFAHACTCV